MSDSFTASEIEKIFEGRFSHASNIELLWKGEESFKTIFKAVESAKDFICLEFYIFRNDETGSELAALLKQKSMEGVRVYLIYDHFGSFGTPRKFWKDLKSSGIDIKASHPFKWTDPCHYVHRDHKKLIIIDGKKAFTGGLNIANEYSGFHFKKRGKGWRDTGIMLEGPIVNDLLSIFAKSWMGSKKISNFEFRISNHAKGDIPAIPIFVNSAKGRRRMRRLFYYSINHSRKSISLTTAYFTPSRRMVETLENAVKRGVKVRLLLPGISDVPAASYAGKAFFSRLLKAGVEIYNYTGKILHAKSYIFYDCWGIIGSTNLDFQSLRYNDEGNVGILDSAFVSRMADIFEDDLKHSTRINPIEWQNRPLKEKVKELFFSLFRRRL